jgi:hypothetical protein
MATKHTRSALRFAAALALPALAACSDTLRPGDLVPADLGGETVRGDGQAAPAGEPLPDSVVVRVLGRGGAPAREVTLEWRVLSQGGGELRFPTTRTGPDGRSGNAWILGPRAGEHQAEVRAVLPGGVVVVDTVRATARAGEPATLEVEGDTLRALAVGDTVRPALRARDRFGNVVPAAQARPAWQSLTPALASVDSAGRVRALQLGDAVLEARAGTATARLRLAVAAVVDVFPVDVGARFFPGVAAIHRGGGRLAAVGAATVYDGMQSRGIALGYAFDGSRWTAQTLDPTPAELSATSLHVTPAGRAYAATRYSSGSAGGVYTSLPGAGWTSIAALRQGLGVAGSGDVLFVSARRPRSAGWLDSLAVYRLAGEQLVDLRLPPELDRAFFAATLAAADGDELYLAGSGYPAAYWNGSAWSAVRQAGSADSVRLHLLSAHPQAGTAWGIVEDATRRLFRLRGGVAERVAFPLERPTDDWVRSVAVDPDGDPYLSFSGGVLVRDSRGWRTLPVPGEWTPTTGLWPEADGSVWVAATRPLGRTPTGAADRQLAFLRIRPRATSSTSNLDGGAR